MQRAASADPALLTAAACLGHVLHEGHEGEQYNLLRSQSLKAFNDSVLAQPTQCAGAITINTLDRISALALVVYADYGAGDMMLAHEHMAMARKMAIQAGLHQIDAGEATAVASPNVERNRLVWWEVSLCSALCPSLLYQCVMAADLLYLSAAVHARRNSGCCHRRDGAWGFVLSAYCCAQALHGARDG